MKSTASEPGLTVHRERYLQLRNEIVALIAEDMIEEELRKWGDL